MEGIDYVGKRVAVIGTGASGVQIIQEMGAVASQLTVYQRTPNLALPMGRKDLTVDEQNKLIDRITVKVRCASTLLMWAPWKLTTHAERCRRRWGKGEQREAYPVLKMVADPPQHSTIVIVPQTLGRSIDEDWTSSTGIAFSLVPHLKLLLFSFNGRQSHNKAH